MEKCNCKKLEQERDAAIAERDELKEKYETDMASAKDAYDHKCEYENGIPPLCTVQGNLVQQLAKENDMLRKDAQGLVDALHRITDSHPDNWQSKKAKEALKAWEGREK